MSPHFGGKSASPGDGPSHQREDANPMDVAGLPGWSEDATQAQQSMVAASFPSNGYQRDYGADYGQYDPDSGGYSMLPYANGLNDSHGLQLPTFGSHNHFGANDHFNQYTNHGGNNNLHIQGTNYIEGQQYSSFPDMSSLGGQNYSSPPGYPMQHGEQSSNDYCSYSAPYEGYPLPYNNGLKVEDGEQHLGLENDGYVNAEPSGEEDSQEEHKPGANELSPIDGVKVEGSEERPVASTYQEYFKDEADFRARRDERIQSAYESRDSTRAAIGFPEDPEEQRACVKLLFDAIKNLDSIVDGQTVQKKDAQSVQWIKNNHYPDVVIEVACWDILFACEKAQFDIRMVDPHHKLKREDMRIYENFSDRLEAVAKALRQSKAVCKMLLDPFYLHRLVDAPSAELKRKKNNKKINAQRNVQNLVGRKLLNGEDVDPILENEKIKKEASEAVTPQKSATKPRTAGSASRTTSAKRKRASTKRSPTPEDTDDDGDLIRYGSEEDEDDEDSDESEYADTPTKRRKMVTPKRAPSTAKGKQTPTPKTGKSSTTKGKQPAQTGAGLPSRRQPTRSSATNTHAPSSPSPLASSSSSYPENVLSPEQIGLLYRQTICKLLKVNPDIAVSHFTDLADWRLYAGAYNRKHTATYTWHDTRFTGLVGVGHQLFSSGGNLVFEHFSLAPGGQKLEQIAFRRGDLTLNREYVPGAPHQDGFETEKPLELRALGLLENPFGIYQAYEPKDANRSSH